MLYNSEGINILIHDFQTHTIFSDGKNKVAEMVGAAVSSGATKVCVTDHAMGWDTNDDSASFFEDGKEFHSYVNEIDRLKKVYERQGITVLCGLEVEVSLDGTLRLAPGILDVVRDPARLHDHVDIVVGVIHSESLAEDMLPSQNSDVESLHILNVARLVLNENIDVWGHPFQALHGLLRRQYTNDERSTINSLLSARARSGHPLAIEYNLNPLPRYEQWNGKSNPYTEGGLEVVDERFYLELPKEIPLVIASDSHRIEDFERYSSLIDIHPLIRQRLAEAL